MISYDDNFTTLYQKNKVICVVSNRKKSSGNKTGITMETQVERKKVVKLYIMSA